MKSKYCSHPIHSRPPTLEEFRSDYDKRVDAIEKSIKRKTHSPAEIRTMKRILETFQGYRRCTLT